MATEGDTPTYQVEVTWGTMEFSYHLNKTWNPKTLQYDSSGSWTATGNTATVTNRSTAPVVAEMTGIIDKNVTGIGKTDVNIEAQAGSGSTVSDNQLRMAAQTDTLTPTGSFAVSLTGAPTDAFSSRTIGSLAVTITAPLRVNIKRR